MTNPNDAAATSPTCFNCGTPCDDDNKCSGCGEFVCEDCDVNYAMPLGGHERGLHLEENDDEGSD
jgi:hypothetical protein